MHAHAAPPHLRPPVHRRWRMPGQHPPVVLPRGTYTRGVDGERQSEKRSYAPPIITPRIRFHQGLCVVGGGSLLRSKEGSVTGRLGWPARTPLLFGRGWGWEAPARAVAPRAGSTAIPSSRRRTVGGAAAVAPSAVYAKNSDVRRHKGNGGVVKQAVACHREALAGGGVGGGHQVGPL